jgi:class 3 adenylate cyclase
VGIHAGPVIAGVVGREKYQYDVWGDTVNTAQRLESHGAPDRIHVSEPVYQRLKDAFAFEPRGTIDLKGRGSMPTWFLVAAPGSRSLDPPADPGGEPRAPEPADPA